MNEVVKLVSYRKNVGYLSVPWAMYMYKIMKSLTSETAWPI